MTNKSTFSVRLHVAFLVGFAVVLLVLVCPSSRADELGTDLIYENADPTPTPNSQKLLENTVSTLNRRFTGDLAKSCRAELLSPTQIRVHIAGNDPHIIKKVERLSKTLGIIEFHILANEHDHGSIIQQARNDKSPFVVDKDGQNIAEWIVVAKGKEDYIKADEDIVSRKITRDDREYLEVLIISDFYDLNGSKLKKVDVRVDQSKKPCLVLHWEKLGEQFLEALTSENLSDRSRGITRKLAIISEWRLWGACEIHEKLSDSMIISGDFRQEDLEEYAIVLNSGRLPASLKQIKKVSKENVPANKDKE